MKHLLFLFFFVSIILNVNAQSEMQEGFDALENGDFKFAKSFFEDYLKTDSENITARLCYGRALGLSGSPDKATEYFKNLKEIYPDDFGILINYCESHLWSKKYQEARPLYKKLASDYPDKFGAVLGYANTLSNLKEYPLALEWVEKAIKLDTNNQSAKISKKYMFLGYANQFVANQEYEKGKKYLKSIFVDFPDDKDALLNLANVHLITKEADSAKQVYWRFAKTPKDTITALNGIALAEHIGGKEKKALKVAILSKNKTSDLEDAELAERTLDRYVQALIWNGKFVKARRKIDELMIEYPQRSWVLALRATLGLYTSKPKKSILDYKSILKLDKASFDGNLGLANAFFAADQVKPALFSAEQTLHYYANQKDAKQFIEKITGTFLPAINENAGHTFDNGNNLAIFSRTTIALPFSTRFTTLVSYNFRNTENTLNGNQATTHEISAGLEYKFMPKTTFKGQFGLINSQLLNDSYTQPVLDLSLAMQPFSLESLTISYKKELQSFNADLIEAEIIQDHFGLVNNLGSNFGLGWYLQMIHTEQSDENTRELLFTSLYYSVFKKPALKLALNYQYLSFGEQVPLIYFSPSEYHLFEFYGELIIKFSEKTNFLMSAASGLQNVEDDPTTNTFRSEVILNHEFSKRFKASLYGKYSNIASATAAGFEFTEVGLKFDWSIFKRPLFPMPTNENMIISNNPTVTSN